MSEVLTEESRGLEYALGNIRAYALHYGIPANTIERIFWAGAVATKVLVNVNDDTLAARLVTSVIRPDEPDEPETAQA